LIRESDACQKFFTSELLERLRLAPTIRTAGESKETLLYICQAMCLITFFRFLGCVVHPKVAVCKFRYFYIKTL